MNAIKTSCNSTIVKPILDDYYVRAMEHCDLAIVERIEKTSYETFWGKDDFETVLDEPCMHGRVITQDHKIVGHYLFQLLEHEVELWTITVIPGYRRKKLGSNIINSLFRDHVEGKRDRLICHVRESNLAAHLFLKKNGMVATKIHRDYFVDDNYKDRPKKEDAYVFVR